MNWTEQLVIATAPAARPPAGNARREARALAAGMAAAGLTGDRR